MRRQRAYTMLNLGSNTSMPCTTRYRSCTQSTAALRTCATQMLGAHGRLRTQSSDAFSSAFMSDHCASLDRPPTPLLTPLGFTFYCLLQDIA